MLCGDQQEFLSFPAYYLSNLDDDQTGEGGIWNDEDPENDGRNWKLT